MKRSKRILTAFLASAVTAVSCSGLFSATAATQYNAYRYYFDVTANAEIEAYNANISHNPNSVIYVSSTTGDLGGTFSVSDVSITTSKSTTYVSYTNASPSSNSGCLGTVTFKTTSSSTPTVNVTLISGTNVTGAVSVNKVLLGDVDLDGDVDNDDVTLLKAYVLGTASLADKAYRSADVDGNGTVNGLDTVHLLQYVNGITDSVLG